MVERKLLEQQRRRLEQRRQREFEERIVDRFRFVPVPKPRTGIKPGNEKPNLVMGKERPNLGVSGPIFLRGCLRDLMAGLAVYILTVRVKDQFLHRDGVTYVTHRHIWHQSGRRKIAPTTLHRGLFPDHG